MEALSLVVHLLEKVSVLVAVALVLLLLRPAEVWLGEAGPRASVRRRIFLVILFGALAIWGTFLGFELDGMRFNIRMVGIIVAGYLGGAWVGFSVGALAGGLYAFEVSGQVALYVFVASIFNGVLAGWWSRRFGTPLFYLAIGAFLIQGLQHLGATVAAALIDWEAMLLYTSRLSLHIATIVANSIGIILFMGLLSIVRELEMARKEVSRSRADARDARLEALQYQLQPHFLFNLLNTLAYLIRTEPVRARELTLDLADFLRFTLDATAEETSLEEELVQLTRYVDLERARFGDGLQFEVHLAREIDAARLRIPPLLLQPLVENGIRHGTQAGKVTVELCITRSEEELHIAVLDNGPGLVPQKASPSRRSLGLANVEERLERYFQGRATLALSDRDDGTTGALALITIQLRSPRKSRGVSARIRHYLRELVK